MTMTENGVASFLQEAIRQKAAIDLHCDSGSTFAAVTPTGLLHGTVEVVSFGGHRFVVVISKIEWVVLATYGEGELP